MSDGMAIAIVTGVFGLLGLTITNLRREYKSAHSASLTQLQISATFARRIAELTNDKKDIEIAESLEQEFTLRSAK